jgi:hypothetical protein
VRHFLLSLLKPKSHNSIPGLVEQFFYNLSNYYLNTHSKLNPTQPSAETSRLQRRWTLSLSPEKLEKQGERNENEERVQQRMTLSPNSG